MSVLVIAVLLGFMIAASPAVAGLMLDWPGGALMIRDDGRVWSLVETRGRRECARETADPVVVIRAEGRDYSARQLSASDGGFAVEFEGIDTVLEYTAEPHENWVLLRLHSVSGTRPESITLQLPIGVDEHVGRLLNIGWDRQTAVCLMAGSMQLLCRAARQEGVLLTAMAQDAPGPSLEGAAIALIVCPTEQFRAIAREVSQVCGLPVNEDSAGTPVKQTELVRGAYWFIRVRPSNIDDVLKYCRLAGIGQVMMDSGSWCKSPGHYTFTEDLPKGRADLKAMVDRFHENGILVGMHCFVSKVSKTDAYVTPVPDRRFWVDMRNSLAADISSDATEISVRGDLSEWAGSPVASQKLWEGGVAKHRECLIGDEIIRYEAIGPEGQWNTFLDCERGAWGTSAAAHTTGDEVRHYGVDGCINGYIIDQETDLMDEVADRIADIFNDCGFDMVYFDGGEDVDRRRFFYYSSNFQHQAMKRFGKRPIIHMGTILTHRLWHSFARSGTVDTYLNTLHGEIVSGQTIDKWPTVRDHINRSVRRNVTLAENMMPGELGWFGIWPPGENTDGLQLDELEYLLCKSLALDAPISLQTDVSTMEAHPLTPGLLEMFRQYEQLRMDRALPREQTAPLGEIGRDFVMLQDGGDIRFAAVEPLEEVGGSGDVRATVGAVASGSVATIWHFCGREGAITLDLPPGALKLTGFDGEQLAFEVQNGRAAIPFAGRRNTLLCEGIAPGQLHAALRRGEVAVRPPTILWVKAADFESIKGEMALGSAVGVADQGALTGDVLVCTARPGYDEPKEWFAQYTVDIPHAGPWTLWARMRYPEGGDASFGLVRPGEKLTLKLDQALGNCGQNDAEWHWTGRGGGMATAPPGLPITLVLDKGPFTLRIYAREGSRTDVNPRLDLICISDIPAVVPDDDMARKALGGG